MRSSVAVISPPLIDPTYMLTRRIIALPASIEYVNGNVSAITIAPVRPGMAPTVIPRLVPMAIRMSPVGAVSSAMACSVGVTIDSFYYAVSWSFYGKSVTTIFVSTN